MLFAASASASAVVLIVVVAVVRNEKLIVQIRRKSRSAAVSSVNAAAVDNVVDAASATAIGRTDDGRWLGLNWIEAVCLSVYLPICLSECLLVG